jgi:hypothetical protein
MSASICAILNAQVAGNNGAGAVSISGLNVGDIVVHVVSVSGDGLYDGLFEPVVSVANELQQTSSENLSAVTLTVVLIRTS